MVFSKKHVSEKRFRSSVEVIINIKGSSRYLKDDHFLEHDKKVYRTLLPSSESGKGSSTHHSLLPHAVIDPKEIHW